MSKVQVHSKPVGGEKHLRGRQAGVEGTYGRKGGHGPEAMRHHKDVAEATVIANDEHNKGGTPEDLHVAAKSLYDRAVGNKGGGGGDKAMTER